MKFVNENPKAIVTVFVAVSVFILKTFVFQDSFSPEVESSLNIVLPSLFIGLLGRFTRITKSEAQILKQDSRNQLS